MHGKWSVRFDQGSSCYLLSMNEVGEQFLFVNTVQSLSPTCIETSTSLQKGGSRRRIQGSTLGCEHPLFSSPGLCIIQHILPCLNLTAGTLSEHYSVSVFPGRDNGGEGEGGI